MSEEYIRKADAKDALQGKVFHNLTDEFYGAMQAIDYDNHEPYGAEEEDE